MVSKAIPTINVKGKSYEVNQIKPGLLEKWKRECLALFPRNKIFNIILIDPPWMFRRGDYSKSQKLNGLATYPTQHLDDIKSLPIHSALSNPGALFLWCTGATLPEALALIKEWKLQFVTIFHVWVKTNKDGKPVFGTGAYVRNSSEILLLARKGVGLTKKIKNHSTRQVIFAPRTKHSEKPPIVHEIIENFFDLPAKLELYARKLRKGWSAWGLEVSAGKNKHFYHEDPGYKDPQKTSKSDPKSARKSGGSVQDVPMDQYVIEEFTLPKKYFVDNNLTGIL